MRQLADWLMCFDLVMTLAQSKARTADDHDCGRKRRSSLVAQASRL